MFLTAVLSATSNKCSDEDESPSSSWREQTDASPFAKKFTVKDALQMLRMSTAGPAEKVSETSMTEEEPTRDKSLQRILEMVREADIAAIEQLRKPKHRPATHLSKNDILFIPSDASILANTFACSENRLIEKEELVHPCLKEAYRRFLMYKALPNSTFRRLPKSLPPPPPTFKEVLEKIVMRKYFSCHGFDKPKPNYPILPPRVRPPAPKPTETEPKGKKGKRGKKGKGKKTKEPEEPFDMTNWRKNNLPAASTRLVESWFTPPLSYQPTPPASRPPSPPGDLPEPISYFGYFVANLNSMVDSHQKSQLTLSRRIPVSVTRSRPILTFEGFSQLDRLDSLDLMSGTVGERSGVSGESFQLGERSSQDPSFFI